MPRFEYQVDRTLQDPDFSPDTFITQSLEMKFCGSVNTALLNFCFLNIFIN